MKNIATSALAVIALISSLAIASATKDSLTIEERIKPVGEVCMAGDSCAAAVVATVSSSGPRTGEQIYGSACTTCHAAGVAGAPKLGDVAEWSARLSDKGLAQLYLHAIAGFQGMPAKGMCFDCSDDEIKVAVDYLLDNSK